MIPFIAYFIYGAVVVEVALPAGYNSFTVTLHYQLGSLSFVAVSS